MNNLHRLIRFEGLDTFSLLNRLEGRELIGPSFDCHFGLLKDVHNIVGAVLAVGSLAFDLKFPTATHILVGGSASDGRIRRHHH